MSENKQIVVRVITHKNYLDTHDQYLIPVGESGAGDLTTEEEWNELYGGDVYLPYADELPEGVTCEDLCRDKNYEIKLMDEAEANELIDATQKAMDAMVAAADEPTMKARKET